LKAPEINLEKDLLDRNFYLNQGNEMKKYQAKFLNNQM